MTEQQVIDFKAWLCEKQKEYYELLERDFEKWDAGAANAFGQVLTYLRSTQK